MKNPYIYTRFPWQPVYVASWNQLPWQWCKLVPQPWADKQAKHQRAQPQWCMTQTHAAFWILLVVEDPNYVELRHGPDFIGVNIIMVWKVLRCNSQMDGKPRRHSVRIVTYYHSYHSIMKLWHDIHSKTFICMVNVNGFPAHNHVNLAFLLCKFVRKRPKLQSCKLSSCRIIAKQRREQHTIIFQLRGFPKMVVPNNHGFSC